MSFPYDQKPKSGLFATWAELSVRLGAVCFALFVLGVAWWWIFG